MDSILNGDIECYYSCGSLRTVFLEALPVTISLVVGAALIAVGLGVGLALICVRHRGRWQDRLITTAASAAYSVPSLVLAALLWAFLSYRWQIFPEEGYVGLRDSPRGWAKHLLLPWIASALPFAGAYVHVVRASLLDTVDQDWVRTARVKGLSEKRVIRRHVLRNGLIPPVNTVIFGLPGVGGLTSNTIGSFDLPPIVALAVYLAIVVVLVSAIVDVIVAWLDPRLRQPEPST